MLINVLMVLIPVTLMPLVSILMKDFSVTVSLVSKAMVTHVPISMSVLPETTSAPLMLIALMNLVLSNANVN